MTSTRAEPSQPHAVPMVVIDSTGDRSAVSLAQQMCDGERLDVVALTELRRSNHWELLSRVRFVLARYSGDPRMPLATPAKLASIHLLPVAVVAPENLSEQEVEALRRHGASVVLDGSAAGLSGMRRLLRSTQWFSSQLDIVPVADTIQILATSNRSGALVLTCPHCRPFSSHPWSDTKSRCAGDGTCAGAAARIYMQDGQLVHAETPTEEGLEALASCLAFKRGVGRFCEVFIPPLKKTLSGSATQLIIEAATLADEAARGNETPGDEISGDLKIDMSTRGNPPPPPARVPPPRLPASVPEQLQGHQSDVSLVVHADANGSVHSVAGHGDGDGVAAVAAITSQAFDRAVGSLGLGELEGWTIKGQTSSCVVAVSGGDFVAATSSAPKDAFKQLEAFLRRVQSTFKGPR